MRTTFLAAWLTASTMVITPAAMAATQQKTYEQQVKHRRHVNTAKRVGGGAAAGAVVGALTGHPVAGAAVGAGAGAVYDHHKKKKTGQ